MVREHKDQRIFIEPLHNTTDQSVASTVSLLNPTYGLRLFRIKKAVFPVAKSPKDAAPWVESEAVGWALNRYCAGLGATKSGA